MFNKHNIEIKAKVDNPDFIRKILRELSAEFRGIDHQIDTYFKARQGRLKIREGNIENYLIYYERENKKTPKKSDLILCEINNNLKNTFHKAFNIMCVVRKKREIYFIDNIKFHIDNVAKLGSFVEIEAMFTTPNNIDAYKQVEKFMKLFNIKNDSIIKCSYSDMLTNEISNSYHLRILRIVDKLKNSFGTAYNQYKHFSSFFLSK
ncbi:MAG: class IV adenylate cyclase [Candidatus Pacebacteria bacterium]|nr:class IV adenylate cyclase [Candidatus Paceibacterota bacterium]NUM41791.1 class IV adenylate cyclase [Leptospiraceae bacterium]